MVDEQVDWIGQNGMAPGGRSAAVKGQRIDLRQFAGSHLFNVARFRVFSTGRRRFARSRSVRWRRSIATRIAADAGYHNWKTGPNGIFGRLPLNGSNSQPSFPPSISLRPVDSPLHDITGAKFPRFEPAGRRTPRSGRAAS